MNIDELYSLEPPPVLYHYTSGVGLKGILESRCLWATDSRFLNDGSEIVHMLLHFHGVLHSLKEDIDALEIATEFKRQLEYFPIRQRLVFLTSLTESGNLLSQWRAYAMNGVAIGFDSQQLLSAAANQQVRLGKCIYSADEQQRLVKALVNDFIVEVREIRKDKTRTWTLTQAVHSAIARDWDRFLYLAALLKDEGFSEEREWRLVLQPRKFHHPPALRAYNPPIEFRAGPSSIVPYTTFSLPTKERFCAIKHINIGPTPDVVRSTTVIQMLWHTYSDDIEMGYGQSNIPIRHE